LAVVTFTQGRAVAKGAVPRPMPNPSAPPVSARLSYAPTLGYMNVFSDNYSLPVPG